jgi:hypothetical protein
MLDLLGPAMQRTSSRALDCRSEWYFHVGLMSRCDFLVRHNCAGWLVLDWTYTRLNRWPHTWHAYGFVSVCVCKWRS